jgi:hypothetical protein
MLITQLLACLRIKSSIGFSWSFFFVPCFQGLGALS